jgi:hypothetical protein
MSALRYIIGLATFTSAILPCMTVGAFGVPVPNYGDYNNNGIVDAADYSAFRKYLDSPDETSNIILNDLSPGWVMAEDYGVWRDNFGTSSAGGANSSAVPEPSGCVVSMLLGALYYLRRKRC